MRDEIVCDGPRDTLGMKAPFEKYVLVFESRDAL